MSRIALCAFLLSLTLCAQAQPRQYVSVPPNTFPSTARSDALNVYELRWAEMRKDTTVLCYLKQSVWFYLDSLHIQFTVDSISGRGDNRQALVSRTVWMNGTRKVDSLGNSRWLGYTRKVSDLNYGWYIPADSGSTAARLTLPWGAWSISVWMERILGDPTKNGGADQRPMLHLMQSESLPVWWRQYADSVRASP